jgi:hypothetical protein
MKWPDYIVCWSSVRKDTDMLRAGAVTLEESDGRQSTPTKCRGEAAALERDDDARSIQLKGGNGSEFAGWQRNSGSPHLLILGFQMLRTRYTEPRLSRLPISIDRAAARHSFPRPCPPACPGIATHVGATCAKLSISIHVTH